MNWIHLPGSEIEIRDTPVTWAEYLQFARETGRPMTYRGRALEGPVTQVSADDATAFAEYLSRRDDRYYRLPTLEEMHTLAFQTWNSVTWPARQQKMTNGPTQEYLDEWLDCSVNWISQPDHLHCITHPTWLLTGHQNLPRGALTDRGYSFVTFRLARSNHA